MRIISGNFRGKQIKAPVNLPVRPTTDFAKTGLFNMLNSRFRMMTLKVLDLYAGTGSLSYEFFSRGSMSVTAVDHDAGCVKFIRQTFEMLKAPSGVSAVLSEVNSYLERTTSQYDIIIADPPFAITPAEELVTIIFEKDLLTEKGIFILEHKSTEVYDALPHFLEKRKYGNVTFTFFKKVG